MSDKTRLMEPPRIWQGLAEPDPRYTREADLWISGGDLWLRHDGRWTRGIVARWGAEDDATHSPAGESAEATPKRAAGRPGWTEQLFDSREREALVLARAATKEATPDTAAIAANFRNLNDKMGMDPVIYRRLKHRRKTGAMR